jgi:predicted dehydrogenase/NADPH:quinone reductase-like Zn-dependent oxidoreductase
MKQVLQNARNGEVAVTEVPAPRLVPGSVLVRVGASLVSAGTERASAEFAGMSLFQKASARPDLVREVIAKARRDGVFSAVAAVRGRLDQPGALGYSCAGTVVAVGDGVAHLRVGERVACAGAGHAVHAELVTVPRLLVAGISDDSSLSFEEAAFSTVGAVALHGIRTAAVNLGDNVAVIGLGLLGQLTVQMLKAAGCRVLGLDIVPERADLALRMGADEVANSAPTFVAKCRQQTGGSGVDAVLITAETQSSNPANLAAEVARDRGVIVAVGTVGMELQRKRFYEKELDFRVSRSYGPGRYDAAYEQKGRDYPIGYVRWTETRNMHAVLRLMEEGKLDVKSLITHRFPIEQARQAYDLITSSPPSAFLGVLITYPERMEPQRELRLVAQSRLGESADSGEIKIGVLGAGSFALSTLLPALKHVKGVNRISVCSANGSHARHAAEKFGFQACSTDEKDIVSSDAVNAVLIATRHHLHSHQVSAAMQAGKHVFCEKPLCLTEAELGEIVRTHNAGARCSGPILLVGFNRRFSPMARRLKSFVDGLGEPLAMHYRVNAGRLPPDHWVCDPEQGGGRILGEVCHFIDFLYYLAGATPVEVQTRAVACSQPDCEDNVVVSLRFSNGSHGTISYLTSGDRAYSKERLEVFAGGAVAVLEDFRRLELVRGGRKQVFRSRFRRDKGHRAELSAFAAAIREGAESPIPFDEVVASTLATLCARHSQISGGPVPVDVTGFIEFHSSAHRAIS